MHLQIRRRQSGFTLIEVMVALAIMAVLSLLTTQAIRTGISNKTLVSNEIDREARLNDALRIMRSDIASAFHYQDIHCKLNNALSSTPAPAGQQGGPGGGFIGSAPPASAFDAQPEATPKPCPPNYTGFIGNPDSLYFTSLSNVRKIRDEQTSDQAKIGYFVKSCRIPGLRGTTTSQCLYRSISPVLDEDLDKPGPATLLLEHVTEFKLRYLGPEHQDFVDTWRTGKDGNEVTRDKFPYAVEITLTIQDKNDPKDRPATQTILAPIRFENNPKKEPSPTPGQGQPPQRGTR